MTQYSKNIVLSICIPTYNRGEYLEKTILSIVSQKRFVETDDVEIIVSDNFSTDNTREISEKYTRVYGEKVRYYVNSENIADANFAKALSYGRGTFLKINNDTLTHQSGSLDRIIEVIQQHAESKEILFFSNAALKNVSSRLCENLDSFVKTVSFHSTWIGGFGIWKDDYLAVDNFSAAAKLQLINCVLFRQIIRNRSVYVDNSGIFASVAPTSKGGYNIYQVFVGNYVGLLEEYRGKKQISALTLFNEKTKLMLGFLVPWTANIWCDNKKYTFDQRGGVRIVLGKYLFHPSLYIGVVYLGLRVFRNLVRDLLGAMRLRFLRQ